MIPSDGTASKFLSQLHPYVMTKHAAQCLVAACPQSRADPFSRAYSLVADALRDGVLLGGRYPSLVIISAVDSTAS
jgi:hypothetical protein